MQLRFECNLTLKQYVAQQAWKTATLSSCPLHPNGGCGFCRWGTYVRTVPIDSEVARYYCPLSHRTFSLLPDCLAAGMGGTLEQAEQATKAVEQGTGSLEQRAQKLRPPAEGQEMVGLQGAAQWMKRRDAGVKTALAVLVALMPELSGCSPTITDVGRALGCEQGVLVELRRVAASELELIPRPVGFLPRGRTNKACRRSGASGVVSSPCEAVSLADEGVGPCKTREETRGRSPP